MNFKNHFTRYWQSSTIYLFFFISKATDLIIFIACVTLKWTNLLLESLESTQYVIFVLMPFKKYSIKQSIDFIFAVLILAVKLGVTGYG